MLQFSIFNKSPYNNLSPILLEVGYVKLWNNVEEKEATHKRVYDRMNNTYKNWEIVWDFTV